MTTEKRLETLERELGAARRVNDRLLFGIGALIAASIIFWGSYKSPYFKRSVGCSLEEARASNGKKPVYATAFVLEDDEGKSRAVLRVLREGAGLVLYDESGQGRGVLSVSKNGAGLTFFDESGKVLWTAPQ